MVPVVGLLFGQGEQVFSALLGAWKAGCSVVVLSPELPDARILFMLNNSKASVIVTSSYYQERAVNLSHAVDRPMEVVNVEDHGSLRESSEMGAPPTFNTSPSKSDSRKTRTDDSAYVVYTSGSSGTPKGVSITHKNVLPLIRWQRQHFEFGPETRLAQTLSLSFDFGLQQFLTSVLLGGSLVIPCLEETYSAQRYAEFLRREKVNTLYLTPSFANALSAADVRFDAVHQVLLGGELLHASTVAKLREKLATAAVVWNGYGPTEVSINVAMEKVEASELDGVVPVGGPSGSSRIYVLDGSAKPIPKGLPGEIYLGGPGVAEGYLGNEVLSQQVFLPDRFGEPGDKMYRTGDVGRWLSDDRLEILGRKDDQIKVRGFRVEPGEVEAIIASGDGVHRCVVSLSGEGLAQRLVAFVVVDNEFSPDVLKQRLELELPPYLIPGQIFVVDDFPLTANGKIDRKALQSLEKDVKRGEVEHQSPIRDGIEEKIIDVWQELLGEAEIDRTSTFFGVGGHSLLVLEMTESLRDRLSLSELACHIVFEFPTVQELADYLRAHKKTQMKPIADTSSTRRDSPLQVRARRQRGSPRPLRVQISGRASTK